MRMCKHRINVLGHCRHCMAEKSEERIAVMRSEDNERRKKRVHYLEQNDVSDELLKEILRALGDVRQQVLSGKFGDRRKVGYIVGVGDEVQRLIDRRKESRDD